MFVCKPKSKRNIQDDCLLVRKALGMQDRRRVPIVAVLERAIPLAFEDFSFAVVPDAELPDAEAKANPATQSIRVRESVYLAATNGNPRARFTLAHELGHLFTLSEIPDDDPRAGFFRRERNAPSKAYLDPEWQADEFAADFLAPVPMVRGLSTAEVAESFGVSITVAMRQLRKVDSTLGRSFK